jgi:SpoVK/Ycf46/Vps4 family AAA+-type ATPase
LAEIDAYPSRSCLIYGAPGTGKTHLALWMAQQMHMPIVLARLDGLMSSFLGTTSRNIGNLFRFASKYNCILLLDEFDAIAKLRNDPQEVGEIKRVVNTLLQNLDSRRDTGFTIGITNHEALLDPAVWRRFDIQMEIPKPSPNVMASILEKNLVPLRYDNKEIQFLTWCLDGGTGADSKTLVQWLKKSHVIDRDDKENLVGLLQRFALLNAGRVDKFKRNALAHSDETLIAALLKEDKFNFKQKDVASLMGITPSTMSKRIAKIKETGSESSYGQ